jgi:hypothetical protein
MLKDIKGLLFAVTMILISVIILEWSSSLQNSDVGSTRLSSTTAPASGTPTSQEVPFPPSATSRPPETVVAKVNGERITLGDVNAGINKDTFGSFVDGINQQRLRYLIESMVVRQFLKEHGIEVQEADVEREVEYLKQNPPPLGGCMCCSYNSLDAYLANRALTYADLRNDLRNNIGLDQYVMTLWNTEHPVESLDKWVQAERPRVEASRVHMADIFFNTAQQPGFQSNPDGVRKQAREKALKVWRELQKGADFVTLARKESEDTVNRSKGGDLGCVPKDVFGKDVEITVLALKPGEYSRPVESPWGYHIILRHSITDQDVLDVLLEEYKDKKKIQELYETIRKNAKIEKF